MKRLVMSILLLFITIGIGDNSSGVSSQEERYLSNIKQLTFEGDNGEAYFSFDGKKLIYQSNRGYNCDKIWIMNIDGTDKKMVSPSRGAHTCAFFFPDGKRIIFSSTYHLEGECPEQEVPKGKRYVWPLYPYDIYVSDVDGKNLRQLTENPEYDAEAVVSPDGRYILFTSKRNGDMDIYIMKSDGTELRRLTDRFGYDGGAWFSPDGKKIVWRAWYPETEEEIALWKDCMKNNYIVPLPLDLWVMDADGTNKKRLLHNGATNWAPSWHPDGKRIIFSSNMDDWREDLKQYGHNFELYIINSDGTALRRITYNNVFDSFPMFSPDGKKLVFASNRNPQKPRQTDIFIADWIEPEQ